MTGNGNRAESAPRWPVAALLLAGAIVWANSFAGAFVNDDRGSIVVNPGVRRIWPLWESMQAPLDGAAAGRPLVGWSVAVNYAIGGLEVGGYHAFNLAVHLLAALVLYGLLRRSLTLPAAGGPGRQRAVPLAFAIALLWTVHPLQTESVTYIIQRAESMTGLFYLTTLWASLRAATDARPGLWSVGSVAACACGMACKESMVTAPLAVFLFDGLLVFPSFAEAWTRRRGHYAALAATWLLLAVLVAGSPRPESTGVGADVPAVWPYLRSQAGVLLHYLRLAVWPHPQIFQYDWPVAERAADWVPQGATVLLLLTAAGYGAVRKHPAGFAALWFFLVLAPTSSVMPILDLCAERRMYLPLAGVLTLIVAGADAALPRHRRVRPLLLGTAALVLGGLTALRNRDYVNEDLLFRDWMRRPAESARALNNLGVRLSGLGRVEEAEEAYRRALEKNPRLPLLHVNVATHLYKRGRIDEAHVHLREALRLAPDHPGAHHRLGTLHLGRGEIEAARAAYLRAVEQDPFQVGAQYGLGLILEREGKGREAMERFRAALEIPWGGRGDALDRLARLLTTIPESGEPGEAVRRAEEAVASGSSARRLDTLARALAAAERFAEAVQAARRAEAAAREEGNPDLAARIGERAKAYAEGRRDADPPR